MAIYQRDLAYVQHHGFSDSAARMAPRLLALFRRHGIRSGTVIDLGSGNGSWLRALTNAGFGAIGVETSPDLRRYSRKVAPRARLSAISAHDFRFPRASAVTALGEVLGYLPHAGKLRSLEPLFRRVAASLQPGGLFVFDLLATGPSRAMNYRNWTSGPDWFVLVTVKEEPSRKRVTRDIVVLRAIGRRYRMSTERHLNQVFDPVQVRGWLTRGGFKTVTTRTLAGEPLLPRRLGFIAKKAG